jgi:hypothetical protein
MGNGSRSRGSRSARDEDGVPSTPATMAAAAIGNSPGARCPVRGTWIYLDQATSNAANVFSAGFDGGFGCVIGTKIENSRSDKEVKMMWFYHPPSVAKSRRNGVRMVRWSGLKWAGLSPAQQHSEHCELIRNRWLAACAAFDGDDDDTTGASASSPLAGSATGGAIDATPGPSASVAGVASVAGADSVTSVIDPGVDVGSIRSVDVEFNMKGALGLTWAVSDPFSGPSSTMIIASVEPDSFGQEAGLQVGQQLLNMTVGGGTVVPVLSTQMDDLCGARARRSRRHALCLKLTAPNSAAPIITTQQRPKRTLATLQATGASMTAGLYSDTDWLTTSCINGVAAQVRHLGGKWQSSVKFSRGPPKLQGTALPT